MYLANMTVSVTGPPWSSADKEVAVRVLLGHPIKRRLMQIFDRGVNVKARSSLTTGNYVLIDSVAGSDVSARCEVA